LNFCGRLSYKLRGRTRALYLCHWGFYKLATFPPLESAICSPCRA
jgi:hypothetical protein